MSEYSDTMRPTPNGNSCPKFSIIVPVYNTEKYLAKCLDSLVNQDISERNYEIIITDDGSTDNSGRICDDYAEKYPFIHVTHTENFGPSHARNAALLQCKGEYIIFCDSDDFVSPQLVSIIDRAVNVHSRPDFIIYRHYTSRNIPHEGFLKYHIEDMKSSDAEFTGGDELCFRILRSTVVGGFTWNKVLRMEIIRDIIFDEELSYCEDVDWFIRILLSRKNIRVCYINYFLYCYVQRERQGQTRDPARIYTADGFPRELFALEKIFAMKDLPLASAKQIKCYSYNMAINILYSGQVKLERNAYIKLRGYMRKYAYGYYRTKNYGLMRKFKTFIKHILILLHIHKPHRK